MAKEKELVRYVGGATRSADSEDVRFDLIPVVPHRRHARRWAEGATIHGEHNWKQGMPVTVILNHLENHLNEWKAGRRNDDHLAAVAWAVYALMECEERGWTVRTGKVG